MMRKMKAKELRDVLFEDSSRIVRAQQLELRFGGQGKHPARAVQVVKPVIRQECGGIYARPSHNSTTRRLLVDISRLD